jgi:hypothetical protein
MLHSDSAQKWYISTYGNQHDIEVIVGNIISNVASVGIDVLFLCSHVQRADSMIFQISFNG